MDETRTWTALYATVAVLIGAVGFAVVVRPGSSATWAYGLVALGAGFFAVSAIPAVRRHDAFETLGAAFATVVSAVAYLGSESLLLGLITVFAAVGTLLELFKWLGDAGRQRFG
ncbi:MAG: hypothetical protein ABEH90_07050 [Halolamina sp.]